MVCATECGIVVDNEFRRLIPPLTDEERLGLEENLLRDGCLDPVIVWAEQQILLDGHNRKEICDRYGIDYDTREVSLPSRDAAADWIDAHQLGRRNLKPEQMSLLRGRRYNRLKKTKAEAGAKGGASKHQNDGCLQDNTGKIAFTDVDGLVEIKGNLLLLEWKDHQALHAGQRILFERMTLLCPATVLIVEGDAQQMTVSTVRTAWEGRIGPPAEADLDSLRRDIREWADWAFDNPVVRRRQEALCE
jgi:hypothetical protein